MQRAINHQGTNDTEIFLASVSMSKWKVEIRFINIFKPLVVDFLY